MVPFVEIFKNLYEQAITHPALVIEGIAWLAVLADAIFGQKRGKLGIGSSVQIATGAKFDSLGLLVAILFLLIVRIFVSPLAALIICFAMLLQLRIATFISAPDMFMEK